MASGSCPICLEPFTFKHTKKTRCGHLFCTACLDRWERKHEHGKGECPVCRTPLSPVPPTDASDWLLYRTLCLAGCSTAPRPTKAVRSSV